MRCAVCGARYNKKTYDGSGECFACFEGLVKEQGGKKMKLRIEIVVETDTLTNADLIELAEAELKTCSECQIESIKIEKEAEKQAGEKK